MSLLFRDTFASGDFSHTENGIRWRSIAWAYVSGGSLRFPYGPDAPGADSTAEARFSLPPLWPDFVATFYLFVPSNYRHRPDAPTNNKLFALWHNEYTASGIEPQVVFELQRNSDDESRIRIGSAMADACETRLPDAIQYTGVPLITKADHGTWIGVGLIIHAEYQNSHVYLFKNGQLCAGIVPEQRYSITCPAWSDKQSWGHGYLMGWANSGYAERTEFQITDFRIYDEVPLMARTFTYGDLTVEMSDAELARADATDLLQAKIEAEESRRATRRDLACRYDSVTGAYAIGPRSGVAALPASWPVLGGIGGPVVFYDAKARAR